MGVVIPQPGDSRVLLRIAYAPTSDTNSRAMQIEAVFDATPPGATDRSWQKASPAVLCNLDRAKAEWVVRNGLPLELRNEMEAKATRKLGFTREVVNMIDPAPYFPAHVGGTK